jgi:hypothetical protein
MENLQNSLEYFLSEKTGQDQLGCGEGVESREKGDNGRQDVLEELGV